MTRTRIRIAAGLLAALALFGVLGFFVAPPLARGQLETLLSAQLGRAVQVQRVAFNPFTLRAEVGGVTVQDRDSAAPALLTVDSLVIDASWRSIFERAPVIDALRLVAPTLRVARAADGRLDVQDLLDRWLGQPSDPNAPMPRFMLRDVEVSGARLEFDDRLADRRHRLDEFRLSLPFLSSLPGHRTIEVSAEIAAKLNGSALELSGGGLPFAADRRAAVEVAVAPLDLTAFLPYLPSPLPVRIASLLAGADLKVAFAQAAGAAPSLSIGGQAELSKVDVRTRADMPLLALGSAKLLSLNLAPLEGRFAVGRLEVDGARATVHRRRAEQRFFEPVLAAIAADGARRARSVGAPATAPTVPSTRTDAPPAGPKWSIAEIALKGAAVDFTDEQFAPRPLALKIKDLDARVAGIGADLSTALSFAIALALDTGERLEASGSARPVPLDVEGKASLARVALKNWWWIAEPRLLADLSEGSLDVRTAFRVAIKGTAPDVKLAELSAELRDLRMRQRWDKRDLLRIGSLKLAETDLDLSARKLVIGRLETSGGRIALERDRDGVLNLERIARGESTPAAGPRSVAGARPDAGARQGTGTGKPSVQAAADTGGAQPWSFALRRLSVDGWDLALADVAAGPAADLKVAGLNLRAEGLSSERNSRGKVALKAKVGGAGSLDVRGALGIEPLAGRLRVDARSIGVLAAQPYFGRYVDAIVSSGALTARGDLAFESPGGQPPKAAFVGEATLADFAAVTREGNEDLLRWKSLHLGGIDFALDPMKVTLGEIALTDFFARVVLSPQGRLNLSDLVVHPDAVPADTPSGAKPQAAAAASPGEAVGTPAAPAPAAASASPSPAAPLPLTIGRITLSNGNVDFTDLFVRPNYSSNLTGLNGSVSTLSADTAGDVELRGQIDNSGSVEVKGRLNPLAPAAFVDLKATVRDIDLPRATPYSVKYLGYGIDKGKFSANLKYTLQDRRLQAENNIILDQLTFGEPVESPTATKLPVLFAVSLLKDRNGVIDVNLPIGGSLDDPQFSVGGIVIRIIFNLIAKAVTAPFSLIAGILGSGGAELSQVPFAAGHAVLEPDAVGRMESLAKALVDRPAVKVDLAGRIDPEKDREALLQLAVERRVKAQKVRERAGAGTESGALDAVVIEPSEYARLLKLAYRAADFPKPRNAIGLVKDLPVEEMEKLMLVNTKLEDHALAELANARAEAVKAWLIAKGGVAGERLFVIAPRLGTGGLEAGKSTLAVDVSLK